jgi:hypothetical protein
LELFPYRIKHIFFSLLSLERSFPGQPHAGQEKDLLPVLATQTETLDQISVTIDILSFQVIEQLATGIHHADQTATGMVVMIVLFEMVLQLVDVGGEQGDLYFGGTSVAFGQGVLGNDLCFLFGS